MEEDIEGIKYPEFYGKTILEWRMNQEKKNAAKPA